MKAIIAMSGGVDSSVAAQLMKNQGYECIGVTMKLQGHKASCCSEEDIEDARKVAEKMSIEHIVLDFADMFDEKVIKNFVHCYENGMTPNPCIECNRYLKFEKLHEYRQELGFDYVVTGHYAQICYDDNSGRYLLKKAVCEDKDQSYVLYSMTQEQLAHTMFPLGTLSKSITRDIASANSFVNANKSESMDICFVPDGDYAKFIREYTGRDYREGNFVDTDGKVLGRHKGIINYTIGQRKGLGLAFDSPRYVCSIDKDRNEVVLAKEDALFSDTLRANRLNLISVKEIREPMRVKAKIRYRQKEQWATVTQVGEDEICVVFDDVQRAVTKGQAVVLYDNDVVVGGGTIYAVE